MTNRYVDLTNGGTLAPTSLSLSVAATGAQALLVDGPLRGFSRRRI